MFAFLDTSDLPKELRDYLPLFLESLLELPLERDGKIIPYEDVVTQLNDDTVSSYSLLGISNYNMFQCGSYSNTACVSLQVDTSKYEIGLKWMRELLYKTIFTPERLKVIAMKMNNSVAQFKRHGRKVASYVMKGMCYQQGKCIPFQLNFFLSRRLFLLMRYNVIRWKVSTYEVF